MGISLLSALLISVSACQDQSVEKPGYEDSTNQFKDLSTLTVQKFQRDQRNVLPRYQSVFIRYGRKFGVSWKLLAAMAYQESHWDSDAESFTGVKGLMQLTEDTADHLGIEDRTDAVQSIEGGAKYLRMLLNRQPKWLPKKDRVALALATYNVGPAHMIDAQNLADHLGKNRFAWRDMKDVLPLLANKNYSDYLRHGPARGREPVEFVHQVFAYWNLMNNQSHIFENLATNSAY